VKTIAIQLIALSVMVVGIHAETKQTVVTIRANDGVELKGTYFSAPRRGPAILLLHQCNMDRRAWDGLASDLAGAGIHVLTLDFRGFGDSGTRMPFSELRKSVIPEKWPGDVESAYAFLTTQRNVDKNHVAVGGASCGVTQASDLAAHHPEITTMLLLSGSASESGLSHVANTPRIAIFGAASEDDKAAATGITNALHASKNPDSVLKIYSGKEHGVPMFAKNPDLEPGVVSWLKNRLFARAQTH
jgi:dienelactone hydrolase